MTCYLNPYTDGGLTMLRTSQLYCPGSALLPHREVFKMHFQAHPHSAAQASKADPDN
jgi:hypothetical protein